MKNDRDIHGEPRRLLDGSDPDAPQELLRALRALRHEQPSAAMLERVVERVANGEIAVDASVGSAVKGAVAGKWLAATGMLAVVGTIASLAWPGATPAPRTELPAPVASSAEATAPVQAVAAPAAEREARAEAAAVAQARETAVESAPPASGSGAVHGPRLRSRRERAARVEGSRPVQRGSAPAAAPGAPAAPASAPMQAEVRAVKAERAEALLAEPPTQPLAEPLAESPRPPLPSEAELLLRARSLRTADPAAALALLDQHARRFGAGLLAVEREVLTIEALRNLGRDAEAARKFDAFRARYPNSPHIRRLDGL